MQWKQLKINLSAQDAEEMSEILMQHDAFSVTFQDMQDDPVFEPTLGETVLWPNTTVVGLFSADKELTGLLSIIEEFCTGKNYQNVNPFIEPLPEKDWINAWKDSFQAMRFGQRLWIVPGDTTPPEPQATNIVLDPGLAFGTGTHPTTALCLEWLDSVSIKKLNVIDFGCGSGILAVAAAKLGANHIWAVDIDPQAILATSNNSKINRVEDVITPKLCADFNKSGSVKTKLLLANILANPLLDLAQYFASLVVSDGKILLSGILDDQCQTIIDCYKSWFSIESCDSRDGWARIVGVRNSNPA